jgi:hypothetical protein
MALLESRRVADVVSSVTNKEIELVLSPQVLQIEQKYTELLKKQMEIYFNSIIKPLAKSFLEPELRQLSFTLDEVEANCLKWTVCVDCIVPLQDELLPKLFNEMVSLLAEFVSQTVEKATWPLQFNLVPQL